MATSASRLGLPAPEEHKSRDVVATFITKVWKIVENTEYNKYIQWSDNGKTFVVSDYSNFARDILPLFFKHSNFSSFVRQLNLYGFRKVSHPEHGVLAKTQTDEPLEFWHTNFRRGHPELLHLVQRKTHASQAPCLKSEIKIHKPEGQDEMKPLLTKILSDVHLMQGRQENIVLVLDALKEDNTHLHHELRQLREKSARQQKVLNKIIQFLVHMVYKGKLPSRRNMNTSNQLMLMDAGDGPPSPKRMRPMANELDSLVEFNDFVPPELNLDTPPTSVLSPESNPSVQSVQSHPFQFDQLTSSTSPTAVSPGPVFNMSNQSPTKSDQPAALDVTPSTTYTTSSLTAFTPPLPSVATYPTSTIGDFVSQPSASYIDGSEVATAQSANGDNYSVLLSGTAGGDDVIQLPYISADLLNEYPIHPAPPSLLPTPHPENRLCINGQVNHQQTGIDAIPDMLSGHLSLDPGLISEFMSSEDMPVPNYDFVDTARLLESLTNINQETVTDESTLYQQLQQGALVPLSAASTSTVASGPPMGAISTAPSELHKLLEEGVK